MAFCECCNLPIMAILNELDPQAGLFKILGLSVRLFKENFKAIFIIYLSYMLILVIPSFKDNPSLMTVINFLLAIIDFVVVVSLSHFIAKKIQGVDTSPRQAWIFAKNNWLKITLTKLLFLLIMLTLILLLVLPFLILGSLVKVNTGLSIMLMTLAVSVLIVIVWFWKIFPVTIKMIFFDKVMAVEERFMKEALDTSSDLMKSNIGSGLLYILYISVIFGLSFGLPMYVILGLSGEQIMAYPNDISSLGLFAVLIWNTGSIVSSIFIACFSTLYYFKFKLMQTNPN